MNTRNIIYRELMKDTTPIAILNIDLYCDNASNFGKKKEIFLKEFTDNPVLQDAIRELINSSNTKAVRILKEIKNEVLNAKLKSSKTSYFYLADIASFFKVSTLKELAMQEGSTNKQKFIYLFKEIEDMFLVPKVISIYPSKAKCTSVRKNYLTLVTSPQKYILNMLDSTFVDFSTEKEAYRITDKYVINALIRSFRNAK